MNGRYRVNSAATHFNIFKQSYEKLLQSLGTVGRHEDFCVLEVIVLDVVLLVLVVLLDIALTVRMILVIV